MNNAFFSFFCRYLNFCPDFCGHAGKQLDKKTMINFKIYDVKNWITKNYSQTYCQISQKLKVTRQ